jgi:hypothetical protein
MTETSLVLTPFLHCDETESCLSAWLGRINSSALKINVFALMNEVTKGADMEGSIKQMLESGGCERDVIAETRSALSNAMELTTNGCWENFYSEEIQRVVTTLLVTRQQPSLDDHLAVQQVDLTADKKDGKSETSSLTDSPKTGKPKAATEKSVGEDSTQNTLADSTTLSVTGA